MCTFRKTRMIIGLIAIFLLNTGAVDMRQYRDEFIIHRTPKGTLQTVLLWITTIVFLGLLVLISFIIWRVYLKPKSRERRDRRRYGRRGVHPRHHDVHSDRRDDHYPRSKLSLSSNRKTHPMTFAINHREQYMKTIHRICEEKLVSLLNPPRYGKKLLVLDIDQTVYDHATRCNDKKRLVRPYLHQLLVTAYVNYDIAFWSATEKEVIYDKLHVMKIFSPHNRFKISFILDWSFMISTKTSGYLWTNVKPLDIVWHKFPRYYNHTNTIMVDDVKVNFMMNPQNGLTIKPYKNSLQSYRTDRELLKLAQYLKLIAKLPDLSILNHNNWQYYLISAGSHELNAYIL